MRWVDVRKRKPASNEEVLGVIALPDLRLVDIVVFDDRDESWTLASDLLEDVPVSHWMPLPKLPLGVIEEALDLLIERER
jgi:uncharacterized protein DUF551